MAMATMDIEDLHGGIELKAAGLIAADTNGTATDMGRGWIIVEVDVTAVEIASNDELYNIYLQGNTQAATSTWQELSGNLVLGATEVTGGQPDSVVGKYVFGVFNPLDNQVRIVTKVNGSIATGVNYSATAYPMAQGSF